MRVLNSVLIIAVNFIFGRVNQVACWFSSGNIKAFERLSEIELIGSSCLSEDFVKLNHALITTAIRNCQLNKSVADNAPNEELNREEMKAFDVFSILFDDTFDSEGEMIARRRNKENKNNPIKETRNESFPIKKENNENTDDKFLNFIDNSKETATRNTNERSFERNHPFAKEDEVNWHKANYSDDFFNIYTEDRKIYDDYDEDREDDFDDFKSRTKRSYGFRADITSIAEMFRREAMMGNKFQMYSCFLGEMLLIRKSDAYLEIAARVNKEVGLAVRREILDSFVTCSEEVECLMDLYEDNDIFPKILRKIYEVSKCNQRQVLLMCIKNDMRQLLSVEEQEKGRLAFIYEGLLENVYDIVTAQETFNSIDSMLTL